jgi:hypothetical protein
MDNPQEWTITQFTQDFSQWAKKADKGIITIKAIPEGEYTEMKKGFIIQSFPKVNNGGYEEMFS